MVSRLWSLLGEYYGAEPLCLHWTLADAAGPCAIARWIGPPRSSGSTRLQIFCWSASKR